MFIRNVGLGSALVVVAAAAAFPAAAAAQDATVVLQEIQKSIGKDVPRSVRVTAAGSGYKAGADGTRQHYRIEEQTVNADGADAAWTTPLGFLAAAAGGQATVATETLFGTNYRVLTFTTPQGQQVRGYVNERQELERIRTQVQDGAGKAAVETIFMVWQDFKGVKYPSLIIHKTNDQVSRILVVSRIEPLGSAS